MAHDNLKPKLTQTPGHDFVISLTHKIYNWSSRVPDEALHYRVLEEYTIRYDTAEKTHKGLDKKEHYRIDAVLFVKPGYRALNQNQTYTVGLEIKGSINDLRHDDKMEAYLTWVDYFFIAVDGNVSNLIEEALTKSQFNEHIGVMDITNGKIYKLPVRNTVPTGNYIKLLQNALYKYLFSDSKTIIIPPNENVEETSQEASQEKVSQRTYRRNDADTFRTNQDETLQEALEMVDPTTQKVFEAISNGVDKTSKIAEEVGISPSAVANAAAALKKAGLIDRLGGCRNATYVAIPSSSPVKFKGKCLKCELYKESLNANNRISCSECPDNITKDITSNV